MAAFVFFALMLLIFIVFEALSKKKSSGKDGRNIKSSSFSDELYDYSVKSKGKFRNPHISRRAMKYRIMKRR